MAGDRQAARRNQAIRQRPLSTLRNVVLRIWDTFCSKISRIGHSPMLPLRIRTRTRHRTVHPYHLDQLGLFFFSLVKHSGIPHACKKLLGVHPISTFFFFAAIPASFCGESAYPGIGVCQGYRTIVLINRSKSERIYHRKHRT